MPLNYLQKRKKCGKVRCRTCRELGGHGPYWYASQTIEGRTVEKYVGKHLPVETQQTIGRTDQSPFVGRHEELAYLLEFLDYLGSLRHPKSVRQKKALPRAHMLLLIGEMGIGKTRLAEEVAREAALRSWPIIWVETRQEHAAPYQLWMEMLRTALARGLWNRLGVLRHSERYLPLRILLPDVLDRWPEETRPSESWQLWEAVRVLLETICERTAVLVVFDDLQRADSKSCELLAYLARHIRGARILFLCTYCADQLPNDHPLPTLLADLQRECAVETLPLAALSDEEMHELIVHVPTALAERIISHTEGNPLFAEELARSSLAGDLTDVARPTRPQALPETIAAVLALRLAHISSECQRLLECGAVLGEAFPLTAIATVSESILHIDEYQLIDLLEEAMQAGTLLEEGSGEAINYHFWHPLVRTQLYNQLSAVRRASLHRRVAQVLQEQASENEAAYAAQIVHHLVQSGAEPEHTVYYAELAAHYAYALSDYKEAEHYYSQVLRYVRSLVQTPEQQEHEIYILTFLAECARIQGDAALARSYYEHILHIYQTTILLSPNRQDAEIQALLWTEIGLCWFDVSNRDQASQCYSFGERLLQESEIVDGPAWAKLSYERAYCVWQEGKYIQARSLAYEALSLFEKHGQREISLYATRLQRVLAGDPVDIGRVHALLGAVAISAGKPEEALTELLMAHAIYQPYHQTRELALVCCNLGDLYMRQAAYEKAMGMFQEALSSAQRMDYTAVISFANGNMAIVALRQQQWSIAIAHIEQALSFAIQRHNTASICLWNAYAAQIDLGRGCLREAHAHLLQALKSARQCRVAPYMAIVLVTLASFHLSQAKQIETKFRHLKRAKRVIHSVLSFTEIEPETRIEAHLLAARLEAEDDNHTQAQMHAYKALDEARIYGIQWTIPLAQMWLR